MFGAISWLLERFAFGFTLSRIETQAPKGRNSIARRSAPGRGEHTDQALKGRNNGRIITPFQGLQVMARSPQAAGLGC